MKKLFLLICALIAVSGCQYDDLWIKEELTDLEERIEELEELCYELNSDIEALDQIIAALKGFEYVTDVQSVGDDGYRIIFDSGREIEIHQGKNGADGKDGYIPEISVKQDTDGEWYWTIDGEWMLDADGNRITTTGRTDLVPVVKIEDMFWYISYDGGRNWTRLGKAVGENGKSFFTDVRVDKNYVHITLADGTELTIPKMSEFSMELGVSGDIPCGPFETLTIPYTLKGAKYETEVLTIAEGDWKAEVQVISSTKGNIVMTAPEDISKGQVVIFASDQVKTIVRSLTFTSGVFTCDDSFILSDDGGRFSVNLTTNYDYDIVTDASWIRYVETKAVREESVVFEYDALPRGTRARSAQIRFKSRFGSVVKSIDVGQGSLVQMEEKDITIFIGEELQLTATTLIPDMDIVWTSSDSEIAWVSPEGKVVAMSEGTATITVMSSDYRHSAQCKVTVADITDYVYLKAGDASNVSFSNGMVHKGTKLVWYFYNRTSSEVFVKYLQLVDANGDESNEMTVNQSVKPQGSTGWGITLANSYEGPKLKAVYEYKGREYSAICGHMFN